MVANRCVTHAIDLRTNGHRPRPPAERAARDFLEALGADLEDERLRETPRRMAALYAELLTPAPFNATTFPRVVDYFARSLQVQERLTCQIAGWLQRELDPKGVGVVLEAEHTCMSLRGVQKQGATTVTSALHGLVRDDPRTRQEFLALATGRS